MPIPPLNRDARKKKKIKKSLLSCLYIAKPKTMFPQKIMQQPQSSSFLFPYPAYAATAPANPMPHHRPLSFADIMMLSPTGAAAAQPKPNTAAAKNKPKSNPTRNAILCSSIPAAPSRPAPSPPP